MARKYVFTHLFDTDEEVQSVCSLLKSKYASSINNLMVEKVPYGFILQIDTKEIAEKTVEQIKAEFEPRPKPEVSKKPEPKPSPKPAEKIQAAQPVKKSPTPQSQPKPAGTAKPAKPDQKTPRPGGSRRKLIGISLSASLVLLIVILAVTGVLQNLFSGNTGETKPSDTIKQTLATSTNIPIILTQNSAADSSSNSTIKSIYVSAKPPVIDGTLSPDEWPVGFIKDFKYSYKGAEKSGMMMGCFMNDDSYLYLAITVRAEGFTPDVFDGGKTVLALDLFFDENNDGVLRKGEDNKRFWDSQYGDNHQENETAPYSTKYDTIQNGEGVRVYSNTTNTYVYECRMPLNSRDSEDLAVKAGDTIGLRAVLSEYQQTEDNKTWRTFGSYGWPGGPGWITGVYGQLVLAKKQPLAPQTPTPMPTSVQPVALRNGLVGLWSGDSNANDDLGINNGSLQGGWKRPTAALTKLAVHPTA